MRFISKALPLFACGLMLVVSVAAQDKGPAQAAPSSCSRDTALEIIQQQIDATRTFDNGVQRITILVRAADLLWPVRESKARGAFTEAFDLAVLHFKEKGDETSREGKTMLLSWPDQRYEVIGAIAKPITAKGNAQRVVWDQGGENRQWRVSSPMSRACSWRPASSAASPHACDIRFIRSVSSSSS